MAWTPSSNKVVLNGATAKLPWRWLNGKAFRVDFAHFLPLWKLHISQTIALIGIVSSRKSRWKSRGAFEFFGIIDIRCPALGCSLEVVFRRLDPVSCASPT